jgi:hypothetical protein
LFEKAVKLIATPAVPELGPFIVEVPGTGFTVMEVVEEFTVAGFAQFAFEVNLQ